MLRPYNDPTARCSTRAPLGGSPQSLHCPRCKNTYKVGWEEWFIRGKR